MSDDFDGVIIRRGEESYEEARRATVWNGRTPDRFPDVIVQAENEQDMVRAVRLARDQGLRLAVKSGGHSWAGNHLHDGGLLLDVSRLQDCGIDAQADRAWVQPGCKGTALVDALAAHDRFFPAGHCPGVAVGGYLLQGGYGWNGRLHGQACMSVNAIDVITADGELVHADETENSDLLWAARGAGTGFFGVVTRFHLRLHPRPRHVVNSAFIYPVEVLEEVFRWFHALGPSLPRRMEPMILVHRTDAGDVELVVTGPLLVDTEEEARAAVALLETCPVLDRAIAALPYVPGELAHLYAGVGSQYPDGKRYAVDNIWTHASIEEQLPGLRRIAETLPEAPSHMLWLYWGAPLPDWDRDAFVGMDDEVYIAVYGIWEDPADDAANIAWARERMEEMEPISTGIQLADENLGERPALWASDENMARLDEIRAARDPQGMFHPWMGRR